MAAKHIKEMTFKEIAENRQLDEAISCIMWEINKRQKEELSGKTMGQLASENKLDFFHHPKSFSQPFFLKYI